MKILRPRGIDPAKPVPHERVAETIIDTKRTEELHHLNRLGFGRASKNANDERLRLLAQITVQEALAIEKEVLLARENAQDRLWEIFFKRYHGPTPRAEWEELRRLYPSPRRTAARKADA